MSSSALGEQLLIKSIGDCEGFFFVGLFLSDSPYTQPLRELHLFLLEKSTNFFWDSFVVDGMLIALYLGKMRKNVLLGSN